MDLYVWLTITALAVLIEFATAEMVSIWFAGGGLIALILSLLKVNLAIQIPVFIVVSFLGMLVFRKYVMAKINNGEEKTNADSVIGKDFELLTKISFNSPGSIKINGVVWSVITENNGDEVAKGRIVTVKAIKGNKYIVEEKQ